LVVFKASREKPEILATFDTASSVYSTPTFANGMMYLTDLSRLYAVEVSDDRSPKK